MQPKLAILDEPDSGVDVLCLGDIMALIRGMADEGMSVLLITHRDEMLDVADSASLMCSGAIIKNGDPREMRAYFARCCRPHEEALGSQPWGSDADGAFQRTISDGALDE
jgi:Fe-S cluster assembly ATP-binding protein